MRLFLGIVITGAIAICCTPKVAPTIKSPKLTKNKLFYNLPKIIDSTYEHHRQIFDALPIDSTQRLLEQQSLLKYLINKASTEDQTKTFTTFGKVVTLFEPSEIYAGKPRSPELDQLANRIITAFSPQGDEEKVLLALCVRITLNPKVNALKQKTIEILNWIDHTQSLTHGEYFHGAHVLEVMQQVARAWPSPFVLETIQNFHSKRKTAILAGSPTIRRFESLSQAADDLRTSTPMLFKTGHWIAQMYLRVDRPFEALRKLRSMDDLSSSEETLRQLLEAAVSPSANIEDQIRLAEHFEDQDRDVALAICRAATRRFTDEPSGFACVGRLAALENNVYLSVANFEKAIALVPNNQKYAEALAQQYQRQLFDAVGIDNLDEIKQLLKKLENFYAQAKKRFGVPLNPSLSQVYFAIGHAYYNAGQIDQASNAFERSLLDNGLAPAALFQLALIHFKNNAPESALNLLSKFDISATPTIRDQLYWQGRIEGLRGMILKNQGNRSSSRKAYRMAVSIWRLLLAKGVDPITQSEIHIYHAQSLYALGLKGPALDELDRAIDANPSRKETYAEVIAFLCTYGHLPEALDVYYRALGRSEVTEYLKTYCTFWIIDLARRAKRTPDPLALQYLKSLSGDQWYTKLSRLVIGETTFEALLPEAKTLAFRTELNFYWAAKLLAEGNLDKAQQLWKEVIASKMMAFFEYDMAMYNLQVGPAKITRHPVDRQLGL